MSGPTDRNEEVSVPPHQSSLGAWDNDVVRMLKAMFATLSKVDQCCSKNAQPIKESQRRAATSKPTSQHSTKACVDPASDEEEEGKETRARRRTLMLCLVLLVVTKMNPPRLRPEEEDGQWMEAPDDDQGKNALGYTHHFIPSTCHDWNMEPTVHLYSTQTPISRWNHWLHDIQCNNFYT